MPPPLADRPHLGRQTSVCLVEVSTFVHVTLSLSDICLGLARLILLDQLVVVARTGFAVRPADSSYSRYFWLLRRVPACLLACLHAGDWNGQFSRANRTSNAIMTSVHHASRRHLPTDRPTDISDGLLVSPVVCGKMASA